MTGRFPHNISARRPDPNTISGKRLQKILPPRRAERPASVLQTFPLDGAFRKQARDFRDLRSKQQSASRVQHKEEPRRNHPQVPHLSTVSTGDDSIPCGIGDTSAREGRSPTMQQAGTGPVSRLCIRPRTAILMAKGVHAGPNRRRWVPTVPSGAVGRIRPAPPRTPCPDAAEFRRRVPDGNLRRMAEPR
jgi:hypothetical protein